MSPLRHLFPGTAQPSRPAAALATRPAAVRKPPQLPWAGIACAFVVGLLFLVGLSIGTLAWRRSAAIAQAAAPAHAPARADERRSLSPPAATVGTSPAIREAAPPRVEPSTAAPPVVPALTMALKLPIAAPTSQVPAVVPAPPDETPPVASAAPAEPPAPQPTVVAKGEMELPGPALPGAAAPGSPTCGTAVAFVASPREAAQRAKKDEKLLFTLHVSGNFEDPGFT